MLLLSSSISLLTGSILVHCGFKYLPCPRLSLQLTPTPSTQGRSCHIKTHAERLVNASESHILWTLLNLDGSLSSSKWQQKQNMFLQSSTHHSYDLNQCQRPLHKDIVFLVSVLYSGLQWGPLCPIGMFIFMTVSEDWGGSFPVSSKWDF